MSDLLKDSDKQPHLVMDADPFPIISHLSSQDRVGNYYNPGGRILTYIATPYFHERKDVMAARAFLVTLVQMDLLLDGGIHTYSPITAMLPLKGVFMKTPPTEETCLEVDKTVLIRCSEMRILQIPGWEESKGIRIETGFCNTFNIPIGYIHWEDIQNDRHKSSMLRACKLYELVYAKGMSLLSAFDQVKMQEVTGPQMRRLLECLLT